MLLAGDVGGTKTTLGLFLFTGDPKTPRVVTTFPSAKYSDLESILREFLAKSRGDVKSGSFIKAFIKKGRMSRLVSRMPVSVVLLPGVALLGAASSGFESVRHDPELSRELRD